MCRSWRLCRMSSETKWTATPFRYLDQITLFQSCTKWVRRGHGSGADRTTMWTRHLRRVVRPCRPSRSAASIRSPACRGEISGGRTFKELRPLALGSRPPSDEALAEVASMIAAARAPIIIAGGGVHCSGAAAELAGAPEEACLPILTTNMGRGRWTNFIRFRPEC